MNDLTSKHCKPCEGGISAMSEVEAQKFLQQVSAWTLLDGGKSIQREFKFKNFHRTMEFVNALAWIAHQEDHHPDLEVGYNRCAVRYSTHAIGGLSENDFICAAKIDALLR
ncbi:MAG TPA: 4a-hydroxytetrahydrobiopterin dehydratase [Gammaproteobacteria bacterium]|nr:4a-hydroxytetrahydrobiopterin dehydratase [Gammaproteobacteria bacterium]